MFIVVVIDLDGLGTKAFSVPIKVSQAFFFLAVNANYRASTTHHQYHRANNLKLSVSSAIAACGYLLGLLAVTVSKFFKQTLNQSIAYFDLMLLFKKLRYRPRLHANPINMAIGGASCLMAINEGNQQLPYFRMFDRFFFCHRPLCVACL